MLAINSNEEYGRLWIAVSTAWGNKKVHDALLGGGTDQLILFSEVQCLSINASVFPELVKYWGYVLFTKCVHLGQKRYTCSQVIAWSHTTPPNSITTPITTPISRSILNRLYACRVYTRGRQYEMSFGFLRFGRQSFMFPAIKDNFTLHPSILSALIFLLDSFSASYRFRLYKVRWIHQTWQVSFSE
jgi:hypothetical protein